MESMHDLELLIDADRQLITLETEEEGCFIEGFRQLARRSTRSYFQWTVTQGLLRLADGYSVQTVNKDINQLFGQIHTTDVPSVYVLVDFHHYLEDPVAIRHIKDVFFNAPQHCLVLLSQKISLPEELKIFATPYRLKLPTKDVLKKMVNDLAREWLDEHGERLAASNKGMISRLIESLCGLEYKDAERMERHAIFNDGIINQSDIAEINQAKFNLLNRDNVLKLELDYAELTDIAGFNVLKEWLKVRRDIFKGKVKLPGGDTPKGMLLLGVQGCGKSLAAKAVAGSWTLPLLHLDFGVLYNRFYGQTEENLRSALDTAEKMQPCVLWLDEIEKGLSAVSSSDDVSKRMLATFLTWLAEKKQPVFIVATANDVTALPPELMRKGRFDEVFFVDLPTEETRKAILDLHLRRREQDIDEIDTERLANMSEGFSGAELEQLIVSALYRTLNNNKTENRVSTDLLLTELDNTRPLSVLMSEKVAALREWSNERAVKV